MSCPPLVEEDLQWDFQLQFENVDWNDIVDIEQSGDSEALFVLMETKKSPISAVPHQDESIMEEQGLSSVSVHPPQSLSLSYAQVVGPAHQGTKRTLSERFSVSPIDRHPKRNASHLRSTGASDTSPSVVICTDGHSDSPDGTPEVDSLRDKGLNICAQRRLFSSPGTDCSGKKSPAGQPLEALTSRRVDQRQKQIDFGKNTVGYQKYIQTVPRWQRKPSYPVTPDKYKQMSTRSWQGQVRYWRRALHAYDPQVQDTFTAEEAALCKMS